jgi:hypothetical protein
MGDRLGSSPFRRYAAEKPAVNIPIGPFIDTEFDECLSKELELMRWETTFEEALVKTPEGFTEVKSGALVLLGCGGAGFPQESTKPLWPSS